jgi:hypothetical protein
MPHRARRCEKSLPSLQGLGPFTKLTQDPHPGLDCVALRALLSNPLQDSFNLEPRLAGRTVEKPHIFKVFLDIRPVSQVNTRATGSDLARSEHEQRGFG